MPSALWPLRVSRNVKEAMLEKSGCHGKRSTNSLIPICQNCKQYYSLCFIGDISVLKTDFLWNAHFHISFFFIKSLGVSHKSFFLILQIHSTVKGEVITFQACVLVPGSICTSSTRKHLFLLC